MRIKDDFILRQVADTYVVIPLATETVNFNGIINLNHSGAMLWRVLQQGATKESLVEALLAEYEVTREQAVRDVDAFISKLDAAHCIDY